MNQISRGMCGRLSYIKSFLKIGVFLIILPNVYEVSSSVVMFCRHESWSYSLKKCYSNILNTFYGLFKTMLIPKEFNCLRLFGKKMYPNLEFCNFRRKELLPSAPGNSWPTDCCVENKWLWTSYIQANLLWKNQISERSWQKCTK